MQRSCAPPFHPGRRNEYGRGLREQRGVLDLSGPAGSKARDNLHGGGLHGGAPANLHAFTSGKGYTPLSGPHKTARFDLAQSQTTLQFYLNISRGLSTNTLRQRIKLLTKNKTVESPKKQGRAPTFTSHLCSRTPQPPSVPSRLSCAALTSSGSAEAPCGPYRSHCRDTSRPQEKGRAPAAQLPERRVGRRHRRRRRRHRWLSRAAAPSRAPQQSAACARGRIARRQGARTALRRATSRQCPTKRARRLARRGRRHRAPPRCRHADCAGPLG